MDDCSRIEESFRIGVPSFRREYLLIENKGIWRYIRPDMPYVRIYTGSDEVNSYIDAGADPYGITETPPGSSLAFKRQVMLEEANMDGIEYLFGAEDDIILDYRRSDIKTKFYPVHTKEGKFLELIETSIKICGPKYPMVHPRLRFHADSAKYRYEKNSPAIRFVCFHVPTLMKHGITFNGLGRRYMSDRYIQHSVNSLGLVSIAFGNFVVGDRGTGTKGGCKELRTAEEHSESAREMKRRFPDNIKLKFKNNGNWNEPRVDCIQYLKKYLDKGELQYVPKEIMEEGW